MSWRRYLRRSKRDREVRDELESYLAIETDDNLARGMSEPEARAAARSKLGNATLAREEVYIMGSFAPLETLLRALRHGLRTLRRNPGFAIVAVLTIAIGVGANTAVFSVVNGVLLQPLPYPNPKELVSVANAAPGMAGLASASGELRLSGSMFFTYSEQNRTFASMGIWGSGGTAVTGLAEPEDVRAIYVSRGALEALGVPPALGRRLSEEDQAPGGPARAMLSHAYWQRRFAGEASVIGRTIRVDSRPREVVGVMPEGFRFLDEDFSLILPLALDRAELMLPGFSFRAVGRLKPGISIQAASEDLARLVPVWMESWPASPGANPRAYESWRIAPSIRPLKEELVGNVENVIWLLMGVVGAVMLIACANVANLLLVRAEARRQELAVRAALGAGWARIARALLFESMLLGLLGGAAGLALAYAGLRAFLAYGPGDLPRLSEVTVDGHALAFTLALSLSSGLLFGLLPALKYARPSGVGAFRSGGRTMSDGRETHRARNVLVVAQVALALVLLVSSGLMIRTFVALSNVEPGFAAPEAVQTVRIAIPRSQVPEPERVIRMLNDIVEKLAAIPGVESAAFASELPMDGVQSDWDGVRGEGLQEAGAGIPAMRTYKYISPGLFEALGTRLVAGRDMTWSDIHEQRPMAILSENLAREMWGEPSAAIGKRVSATLETSPWREVIGVVEDVRSNGVQESAPATVYWPAFGGSHYAPGELTIQRSVAIAIRSKQAGTRALSAQVEQAIWAVNANLPLAAVSTMEAIYERSLAQTTFTLAMLAISSGMALLLGVIGIYGVISYVVSQRRREIGIRSALGAQRGELRWLFLRYGLSLAGVGVVLGLGVSAGVARLMDSLLFGVNPLDPVTYGAAAAILTAAAALAGGLPAQRAASLDPVEALKVE